MPHWKETALANTFSFLNNRETYFLWKWMHICNRNEMNTLRGYSVHWNMITSLSLPLHWNFADFQYQVISFELNLASLLFPFQHEWIKIKKNQIKFQPLKCPWNRASKLTGRLCGLAGLPLRPWGWCRRSPQPPKAPWKSKWHLTDSCSTSNNNADSGQATTIECRGEGSGSTSWPPRPWGKAPLWPSLTWVWPSEFVPMCFLRWCVCACVMYVLGNNNLLLHCSALRLLKLKLWNISVATIVDWEDEIQGN